MKKRDIERDTLDMIVWAFILGENCVELKKCHRRLEDWLNENTKNDDDYKDLWDIFHKIAFIVDMMAP